jgi:hypothetical protein
MSISQVTLLTTKSTSVMTYPNVESKIRVCGFDAIIEDFLSNCFSSRQSSVLQIGQRSVVNTE